MTMSTKDKQVGRARRHFRVRKKVAGTTARPRLAVFRSNKHITAQVIDDRAGRTLASASTVEADLRAGPTGNKDAASTVGRLVAERAKAVGVTKVVFDRGGFLYHGRVAAVADAARAIREMAGIHDILAKSLGSSNSINVAQATIAGLRGLKRPDEVARLRGKSPEEVTPAGVWRAYQETQRGAHVPTEVA